MIGLMRFACLAFVLAAVMRCESAASGPLESPGILMATIQGFVTNGGTPISGAEVSLTGPGITRTTSSGTNGFTFAELPPGSYTLTVVLSGLICEPATVETTAGGTVTANVACAGQSGTIELGTITGTVTAGGVPISDFWLRLTSPTPERRVITDASGAFSLAVPPGAYTVSAVPPGIPCDSASIVVQVDQTVSANIVCQPAGGIVGKVRDDDGNFIRDARVVVNGPVRREAQPTSGEFVFHELPAGDYTVAAAVPPTAVSDGQCLPIPATVQVAQVTRIDIVCGSLTSFGGRHIGGIWRMYLPRESEDTGAAVAIQSGDCPALLPADAAPRTIVFDSASGRLSIHGLDPDLTIAGDLQLADCENSDCGRSTRRGFIGAGSVLRADGSSVRSEMTGAFTFSSFEGGHFSFFASMTREHRDSGDNLVCTEMYQVQGDRAS